MLVCAVRRFPLKVYGCNASLYPNPFSLLSDYTVMNETWLLHDVCFLQNVHVREQSQTVTQIGLLPERQRGNEGAGDWDVTQYRSPGRSSEVCTLKWSLWKSTGPGESKACWSWMVVCFLEPLHHPESSPASLFGTRGPFIRSSAFWPGTLYCCNAKFMNM